MQVVDQKEFFINKLLKDKDFKNLIRSIPDNQVDVFLNDINQIRNVLHIKNNNDRLIYREYESLIAVPEGSENTLIRELHIFNKSFYEDRLPDHYILDFEQSNSAYDSFYQRLETSKIHNENIVNKHVKINNNKTYISSDEQNNSQNTRVSTAELDQLSAVETNKQNNINYNNEFVKNDDVINESEITRTDLFSKKPAHLKTIDLGGLDDELIEFDVDELEDGLSKADKKRNKKKLKLLKKQQKNKSLLNDELQDSELNYLDDTKDFGDENSNEIISTDLNPRKAAKVAAKQKKIDDKNKIKEAIVLAREEKQKAAAREKLDKLNAKKLRKGNFKDLPDKYRQDFDKAFKKANYDNKKSLLTETTMDPNSIVITDPKELTADIITNNNDYEKANQDFAERMVQLKQEVNAEEATSQTQPELEESNHDQNTIVENNNQDSDEELKSSDIVLSDRQANLEDIINSNKNNERVTNYHEEIIVESDLEKEDQLKKIKSALSAGQYNRLNLSRPMSLTCARYMRRLENLKKGFEKTYGSELLRKVTDWVKMENALYASLDNKRNLEVLNEKRLKLKTKKAKRF